MTRPGIRMDASNDEEDEDERARESCNVDDGGIDEPAERVS